MYDTVLTGSNTVKRVGQGESELCKWHMINVTLLVSPVLCLRGERLRTTVSPVRPGGGFISPRTTLHTTNTKATPTFLVREGPAGIRLPFEK